MKHCEYESRQGVICDDESPQWEVADVDDPDDLVPICDYHLEAVLNDGKWHRVKLDAEA